MSIKMIKNTLILTVSCLLIAQNAFAVNLGAFDFENGKATFFMYYAGKNKLNSIYSVDFSTNEFNLIVEGSPEGGLSFSGTRFVAYWIDGQLNVWDIINQESAFSLNTNAGKNTLFYWSSGGDRLAAYTLDKKHAIELNLIDNVYQEVKFDQPFDAIQWSAQAEDFLYTYAAISSFKKVTEAGEIETYDLDLTVEDNELEVTFQDEPGDMEAEGAAFIINKKGQEVARYSTNQLIKSEIFASQQFDNVIRVFFNQFWGVSFKVPDFVIHRESISLAATYYDLVSGPEKQDISIYFNDLALDPAGYVLQWNYRENRFQVEDIREGKVIKTYESLWPLK
ncbi:hypothetical protein [Reinekea sp. G2M2-21]|uniref:hypothetical protein n=1 Tax=Reinekea sp. G2M2-21 TaxID=2788942 RepID=UPI0018AA700F|nr:hypothetical protein [Reinekea sp. G2M2-21]